MPCGEVSGDGAGEPYVDEDDVSLLSGEREAMKGVSDGMVVLAYACARVSMRFFVVHSC